MRLLVTGKNGQLGWELQRTLAPLGDVKAYSEQELDLTNTDAVRACLQACKPQWIINPAAYTAVDKAEKDEPLAQAVNGEAPGLLAEEAKRLGAGLIHFSTDYVFSGNKTSPYLESDPVDPLGAYGRTKLAGEQRVTASGARAWIFRLSWVYASRGSNFLLTMLRLANERPRLRVVADQIGAPTWARQIAEAVALFIAKRPDAATGRIYHMTPQGRTSWHGFAEAIVRGGAERGLCPEVAIDPIATSDYPLPAKRPGNSVLDHEQLARDFGLRLPDWRDSLRLCLDELPRTPVAAR